VFTTTAESDGCSAMSVHSPGGSTTLRIDTVLVPGLTNDSGGVVELGGLVEVVGEVMTDVAVDVVDASDALVDGLSSERWSDEHPAPINAARIRVVHSRAATFTVCRASRRGNGRVVDGVLVS
jgi:hypothetical protein